MVPRTHGQRSVFEIMLPDGDKLWDPVLKRIDDVLEDETLDGVGPGDAVAAATGESATGPTRDTGRGRIEDPGVEAPLRLELR
jgi:hypothetical protein